MASMRLHVLELSLEFNYGVENLQRTTSLSGGTKLHHVCRVVYVQVLQSLVPPHSFCAPYIILMPSSCRKVIYTPMIITLLVLLHKPLLHHSYVAIIILWYVHLLKRSQHLHNVIILYYKSMTLSVSHCTCEGDRLHLDLVFF